MNDKSQRTFLNITDELLGLWKHSPQGRDRGLLAAKIFEWSDGDMTRAEGVLALVEVYDEYPGPATIRAFFKPTGTVYQYV